MNRFSTMSLTTLVNDPAFSEALDWYSGYYIHRHDQNALAETVQWIDDQKAGNHIQRKRIGLNELEEWRMDDTGAFRHRDDRFFRIIGIEILSKAREVMYWSQPILANTEPGVIGLLMKRKGKRRWFLMQAKSEPGNKTTVQLGPTVQFTPVNYFGNEKLKKPFLFDEFATDGAYPVIHESWQAEEGARFFQEKHLHRIKLLPEGAELELPPDFRWLTDNQVRFFLQMGDTVNSCARSILACLV